MTDLHDLKQDIDDMQFPVPLLREIVDRARRVHSRRVKSRAAAVSGLVALSIVATIIIVVPSANPRVSLAEPGYAGTANAAFVARDGHVYVADQANNSLMVLNPAGNPPFRPLYSVPLSFAPGVIAVSPDGTMAYLEPLVPEFQGGSDTLYEISLQTRQVVRTIVDRSQPLGSITIAPNGKTAYAWANDVVPIDLTTGQIGAPIANVNGEYTDFAIAPNGQTAFATSQGQAPGIQEIDLAAGTVTRTLSTAQLTSHDTPGRWTPEAVAFSPSRRTAYITVQHEGVQGPTVGLLQISVGTGQIEASIVVGSGLAGNVVIAPDVDTGFVFVQTPIKGDYAGAFIVVPIDLPTTEIRPEIIVSETQGLGLLQLAGQHNLFAVDAQWKITTIDERTDRIRSVSTIALPPPRWPSLQPFAG